MGVCCMISWMEDARDEGFKILNVEDAWRVPGSICVFLASFDSTKCVYEQFAVISKLPRLGAKVLKVIMPFFPSLTLRGEGGERGSGRMGTSYSRVPSFRSLPPHKRHSRSVLIPASAHSQEEVASKR
jgi:hypothetical protein